jgi:ankyrin repeat protein
MWRILAVQVRECSLSTLCLPTRVFAKALLDSGADIDPINVWGNTPLWVVVMRRRRTCAHGSMIRLLLDHGADPTRSEAHIAPVDLAPRIAGCPEDLVELLLQKAQST